MITTKPELSSLEVRAVVREMQVLVGAKVDQVYQLEKQEFFFQFHAAGLGRVLLRVVPGKLMYFTEHKLSMQEPGGLCMQLRKMLGGRVLGGVEQIGSQRIVKLSFDDNSLYVELFSKGNIILCDSSEKIIGILQQQTWQSRTLKVGEKYKLPPMEHDAFSLGMTELKSILKKSAKLNIAGALAVDVGIGGAYSEEVCARANTDKSIAPGEADAAELHKALKSVLAESDKPKGFVYNTLTSPIMLSTLGKPIKTYDTFSLALDAALSVSEVERARLKAEQKYNQKLEELQRILSEQEKHLAELEAEADSESAKGDWFYENYADVKKLLDAVAKARSDGGWGAAEKLLKGLKKITKVDMKEKKITLSQ